MILCNTSRSAWVSVNVDDTKLSSFFLGIGRLVNLLASKNSDAEAVLEYRVVKIVEIEGNGFIIRIHVCNDDDDVFLLNKIIRLT